MDDKLKDLRFDTGKAEKFFTKIMAFTVGPAELKEMVKESKVEIIDVRNKKDFDEGHIPMSISIPRVEMDNRIEELSKDKLYVIYCYNQQCHLGACACRFLAAKGYHGILLEGGFKTWQEDFNYEVEK